MRISIFIALLFTVIAFSACSKNHDNHGDYPIEANLELRAAALGFSTVQAYTDFVRGECENGRHENCDIDHTAAHRPCSYKEHAGLHHNGTHHQGIRGCGNTAHGHKNSNNHTHYTK